MATSSIVGTLSDAGGGQSSSNFASSDPRRLDLENGSPRSAQALNGANATATPAANANSMTRNGKTDLRTRILVPKSYITQLTSGYRNNLSTLQGIIFPYTPTITYEHKAEYSTQNPLHSNHSINFYKYSAVGDISVSGVFTVQSVADAVTYLSIIHLLRALTKGRFGGSDPRRGSPPPVCRLWSYGTFMLQNVPIAITSFKNDLNPDVDYFYLKDSVFQEAYVPVRSTIALTCKPMYSRKEMLDATVPDWLSSKQQRVSGLL
jgi:hypothetical protein